MYFLAAALVHIRPSECIVCLCKNNCLDKSKYALGVKTNAGEKVVGGTAVHQTDCCRKIWKKKEEKPQIEGTTNGNAHFPQRALRGWAAAAESTSAALLPSSLWRAAAMSHSTSMKWSGGLVGDGGRCITLSPATVPRVEPNAVCFQALVANDART